MKLNELINQIKVLNISLRTYKLRLVIMHDKEFEEYSKLRENAKYIETVKNDLENSLKMTYKITKNGNFYKL